MIEAVIALFLVYGSYDGTLSLPSSFSTESEFALRRRTVSEEILAAAKICAARKTRYRMAYPTIEYPGGDISPSEGLCCDLVVRSLRAAGIDLQQLVYEDSHAARPAYLKATSRSRFQRPLNRSWIHRRTASLNLFLERHAESLSTVYNSETADSWRPGDIVIYRRKGWETWHSAIVSDSTDPFLGTPMIIDAWSSPGYTTDKHTLTRYGTLGGHYRIGEDLRENLPADHVARARASWLAFVGEKETRLAESRIEPTRSYKPARSASGFGFPFLFGGR